jgi:proteasome accessory factor B
MQQIFRAIKAGDWPNRSKLADDIEVTTKTIQRDIDFMRDRMNLPIAYNRAHRGYEFSQPIDNFPMVELSEAELISVFVAQKALTQYKGTPFEHPLRSAFDKLISGLDGKITLSWDELDSFISFRNFEVVPTDLHTFQAVSESVRKSEVLEFEYKKINSTVFERRTVEPYHLACILNQWYRFGQDIARREMRTFVLARMRKAVRTRKTFTKSGAFSLKNHLRDSLGVFFAKGRHLISIRFDAFAAQFVRERLWHPSQEIKELPGGGVEIRFTLSSLEEIEPWVLSWGDHAFVLAPGELSRRLRTIYKACAKKLNR